MSVRGLLIGAVFALLGVARPADAQSPDPIRRVALVYTTSPVSQMLGPEPSHPSARAFIRELRARGWIEGRNLILERRSAEGRPERYESILRELLSLKCDVIVTTGTAMARVALKVTDSVPIVMASISDPTVSGIVPSLARPGGNATGLSDTGPEIESKRLELLRQALPKAVRVVILQDNALRESGYGKAQRTAAASLGFKIVDAQFGPSDQSGLVVIERERPDVLYIGPGAFNEGKRDVIMEFATRKRLPVAAPGRLFSGALISYAGDLVDYQRGIADYVDRILRGAKPGDLPIQRVSKPELVVNLKSAKSLGLTVPEAFLLRADEIIR